ncbi:Uncharacterised protein [Moraxella caprae]|uniref:DNA primase (Bacterial type) n=1 Tax=Moraxella caprae TaxID=90240 RepID=A0A378QW15_9GAMM|nr:hypothetical protein [Moraxella caprae]STZ07236.1 Uncharacterised protein [Moraxella caprae]
MYNVDEIYPVIQRLFAKSINNGYNQISLHQYTDHAGKTLFCKARLKNAQGKKQIFPFHWQDNTGQWVIGEPNFTAFGNQFNGKKPLYLLHLLQNASVVWIFEGEQKAELMANLGYVATTTGGSTSVSGFDVSPLAGKKCILWRDFDKAGINWLKDITSQLGQLSPKCEVIAVDVDKLGLAEKGDIVDYLAGCDTPTMHTKINALPMMSREQFSALSAGGQTSLATALHAQTPANQPPPKIKASDNGASP